jgi:hypothetical protein
MQGFDGAWFEDNLTMYARFPKHGEDPAVVEKLNPATGDASEAFKLEDISVKQYGAYLLITKAHEKSFNSYQLRSNCDVEVRAVGTGKTLWTRYFPHELPGISFHSATGQIELLWSLALTGGRATLQEIPDLRARAEKDDYLLEVVDISSGARAAKLLLKSNKGSLRLERAQVDGDWVAAAAQGNQVLTYSLASGDEKGHYFGSFPLISARGSLLAVEKGPNEVDLYDLTTQQLRHRYEFPSPVALKKISGDGKRLFVLTAAETGYLMDVAAAN